MNATAPRWSAILFEPTRTYSAQPIGVKTGDRVYQALPVDSFVKSAKAATVAAEAAAPVMATEIRHVTVKPGDVLALKAQQGDYYWKIARRFAKDDAVGAYAKDLIARNGGSSLVKTGQLLNLPVTANSDYELEMAIAVQKVVQLRSLFGEPTPQLDWGSVEVAPGPVDSFWVSFQETSSQKRQRFMVSDDLSGLYPGRYSVITEPEARQYFPV
jgi:LysM repeat protein